MQEFVKEFIQLVKIPVHSRNERAIADILKNKLTAIGLEVSEDNVGAQFGGNAGNIVAVLRGQSDIEPVMFSAHMDRVANNGDIKPIVDEQGGMITSDGQSILAADNVAGICVILEALRQIKQSAIKHGDIEVVLSVCEEDGVKGSRYLDYANIRSKMALVFDISGRIGRIVNQAPAKCKIGYKIHGRSAHAGNEPEKGINALKAAAELIMNLPDGRLTPETTANIASIHGGGNTTNIVCDLVQIYAEVRSRDAEQFEQYLNKFRIMKSRIEQKYAVSIEYQEDIFYTSFKVEEDEQVIVLLQEAMEQLNIDCIINAGGGGMDGNHFNKQGIKAVGLAPGYQKNHTNDELVYIEDMIQCVQVAVQFVQLLSK